MTTFLVKSLKYLITQIQSSSLFFSIHSIIAGKFEHGSWIDYAKYCKSACFFATPVKLVIKDFGLTLDKDENLN